MTDFERKQLKITWIKAGSVLIGFASMCLTMGYYLGDWRAWRNTTTDRIEKVERWQQDNQQAMNAVKAEKNRSAKIYGQ